MTKEQAPKTFKVVTLGCRTNQYEGQGYVDQLVQLGYRKAQEDEQAEICIVNTCTVTESADSASRHAIRSLAREHPGAKIAVTGCFSQAKPDQVKGMEGVSLVVPNSEKENLVQQLLPEEKMPEFAINGFEGHTRAFVKVQDGCDSFCTYCIIPYVRGRSRSRRVDEIIREVEGLIANGYQEVVLTGINIGDFDGAPLMGEQPVSLAELVRIVDQIPGLMRLRLSSIDPDEVDQELIDVILGGRVTCPSMHIVLQSGSNVILKRMNRKYTRQIFMDTIDRLRALSPDFTFTTDIIVGFPGETEADFADTLAVMEEVYFAKVHMFPYSDRQRTRAFTFPDKVPPELMKKRKSEVLRKAEKLAAELREQFVGRTMSVLTEGFDNEDSSMIHGHTSNFIPVLLPKNNLQPNQIVQTQLIKNSPKGLEGIYAH